MATKCHCYCLGLVMLAATYSINCQTTTITTTNNHTDRKTTNTTMTDSMETASTTSAITLTPVNISSSTDVNTRIYESLESPNTTSGSVGATAVTPSTDNGTVVSTVQMTTTATIGSGFGTSGGTNRATSVESTLSTPVTKISTLSSPSTSRTTKTSPVEGDSEMKQKATNSALVFGLVVLMLVVGGIVVSVVYCVRIRRQKTLFSHHRLRDEAGGIVLRLDDLNSEVSASAYYNRGHDPGNTGTS